MDWLTPLTRWGVPLLAVVVVTAFAVWIVGRAIPHKPDTRIVRQLTIVALVVLANITLVLALPLDTETRGQLLSLFGLVLTAVIALASTTFVSNAMAGLALRAVGSIHVGDFIRVGEQFGRVTERALLHTEVQSEDRDLFTLPNLYLMTQPVRVVHGSGTLISADVSLGYDVHRHTVRDLLKAAAEEAGLTEPFVHINDLGDFAVSYRVYGFLQDVSQLVTTRSELRARMLDQLHGADIEIVSPAFMNQRQVTQRFIPQSRTIALEEEAVRAEAIMFDKAELAARLEKFRLQRDTLATELKELDEATGSSASEVAWRERQIASLDDIIKLLESRDKPL